MQTNKKPIRAVAASRGWKEETSRELDAMGLEARIEFLESARPRTMAGRRRKPLPTHGRGALVREDPPRN